MTALEPEVMERKLAYLSRYLDDLGELAGLDDAGRRAQHYAVERLLQLLCEVAADLALQILKARGETLPAGYREVFEALGRRGDLPAEMTADLTAACGMRNVLTHLYATIDQDRVIAAVDPALDLYERFGAWVRGRLPDPA